MVIAKVRDFIVTKDNPTLDDIRPYMRALKEYHRVYRYYNDGESREKDVPDILDTLDNAIDDLTNLFDAWRKANARGDDFRSRTRTFSSTLELKERIDNLKALRDTVDGSHEIYSYHASSSWADASLFKVQLVKVECFRPVFDKATMKWKASKPEYVDAIWIDNDLVVKTSFTVLYMGAENPETMLALTPEAIDTCLNKVLLSDKEVEWRLCKTCGAPFPIYPIDKEAYEAKGFVLPKNCKVCRKTKKKLRRVDA